MKKNDVILIVVLLMTAFAAFVSISLYSKLSTREAEAVVYVKGEEQGRYPLSQDTVVELSLENGSYNILQIREGKADITEASCPDKICVKHRPVRGKGENLVCLPNQVVVEIENGETSEVAAATN